MTRSIRCVLVLHWTRTAIKRRTVAGVHVLQREKGSSTATVLPRRPPQLQSGARVRVHCPLSFSLCPWSLLPRHGSDAQSVPLLLNACRYRTPLRAYHLFNNNHYVPLFCFSVRAGLSCARKSAPRSPTVFASLHGSDVRRLGCLAIFFLKGKRRQLSINNTAVAARNGTQTIVAEDPGRPACAAQGS